MPKFRPLSIKELLRVGEVDDEELATALRSIFRRGAYLGANDVEYRNSDDEWVLSLRYDKNGKVVDALTGPFFTSTIETEVRQTLADSLGGTTRKVWRSPLFSSKRVEGWYRHNDEYMIRPAPVEAPRPSVEWAQHPWVLEFSYTHSPSFEVRILRTQRRTYELSLLLNLLLNAQISAPSNRGRHHWVFLPYPEGTPTAASAWLQEGYHILDLNPLADTFSATTDWEPLTEVPTDAYYDRRGSVIFQHLTIPATMDNFSAIYSGLGGPERNRFLRSCYWLQMANFLWDYSRSLYLVSLINAVECLAQSGEKRLVPDASTKMFIEFMKEYAPGHPSSTRINKIYEVRSLVTHGERLLGYDVPRSFALHPTTAADDESSAEARLLARGAIINWLVRQAGSTVNLLTTDPNPRRSSAKPGTKSQVKIITA